MPLASLTSLRRAPILRPPGRPGLIELAALLLLGGCYSPPGTNANASTTGASSSGTDATDSDDDSSSSTPTTGMQASSDESNDDDASGSSETTGGLGCGNGIMEADESCDDGNDVDGDGCNTDCVVSGTPRWIDRYDGPVHGDDQASTVALGAEGNLYVGGSHATSDGDDAWLRRYSATGDIEWTREPSDEIGDGDPSGSDSVSSIALDGETDVIVCGTTTGVDSDAWIRKYTAGGAMIWDVIYEGSTPSHAHCEALAIGPGDRVYAAGSEVIGSYDAWLASYGSDGELGWIVSHNGGGSYFDAATAVTVDDEGRPIVAGLIASGAAQYDFWVAAWEVNGSDTAWEHVTAGPGNDNESAYDVVLDRAGMLRVVGDTSTLDGTAPFWIDLDQDGEVQDAQTFPDEELRALYGIALDEAGNTILVGQTKPGVNGADAWIAKLDPAGKPLWQQRHDGELHGDENFRDVAVAGDGTIVAVGFEVVADHGRDIVVMTFAP